MVLAFTQPSQSKTHSLHGRNATEKCKHLSYHVIMILCGSAAGDDVIGSVAANISVCGFPEEKSLMADTWVGNGFVPFEEIIQSQVHGLKRTPAFPCILLES